MSEFFADVLLEFMKKRGYKPAQLAKLAGVSPHTVQSWIKRGASTPRNSDDVEKIIAALRLDLAEANRLRAAAKLPTAHASNNTGFSSCKQNFLDFLLFLYASAQW